MTKTFTSLLDDCELSLNDAANAIWPRATLIAWAKEAILAFPILRPQVLANVFVADAWTLVMPSDFREIVSIEYPVSQEPPVYLHRMNRLDEDFYASAEYFDIDFDFADGMGYKCWFSFEIHALESVTINYLSNHRTSMADDGVATVTIADEHLHIVIAYVMMKAYKERLSTYMQDPTAYSQIINQMVASVIRSEEHYKYTVDAALGKMALSRPTAKHKSDDYDRVY